GAGMGMGLGVGALLVLAQQAAGGPNPGASTKHPPPPPPPHPPGGGGGPGENVIGEEGPSPGCCRLICKPSALARCLQRSLQRFAALPSGRWLWTNWPHLQTMIQLLLPTAHPPELARELLQLADGGLVALDWVIGAQGAGKKSRASPAFGPAPVLLVLPNAAGKVTRGMLHLCLQALEQGYQPFQSAEQGRFGNPREGHLIPPRPGPLEMPETLLKSCCRNCLESTSPARSEELATAMRAAAIGGGGGGAVSVPIPTVPRTLPATLWLQADLPQEPGQAVPLARYATALAEVVDTARLFRSRSLREFEETLFCQTKRHPVSWQGYWDRNDPLRDVDEVAVPVLCICSADDPVRGPPASTLPMELFHSSPYFFLLLTPHGGHCGFLKEGPCSWSHEVTLEYFRVVAEFFHAEERMKGLHRRRRGALQKREAASAACDLQIFSWQRCYTR
uniref:Abhydrolase domain containing 15 n=1 Tax=Pelodiscus sinensis TaxID=13735 RepID=K7F9K7_PELSI